MEGELELEDSVLLVLLVLQEEVDGVWKIVWVIFLPDSRVVLVIATTSPEVEDEEPSLMPNWEEY